MIGKALRMDIEMYAGQVDRNPILIAIEAGKMTRPMVARYVGGLHFMLCHSAACLVRAKERSEELGNERLAEFFRQRLIDEVGHEVWAENDLHKLQAKPFPREDVLDAAKAIVSMNEGFIETNPALWLAYIAFCEYFTVIKAPEWLLLLEERCGIPRAAMTAVKNHAELDRDHAEEVFDIMDEVITDPKMLSVMRDALRQSISKFEAYCAEAAVPIPESSSINVTAEADSTPHVSAA